MDHLNIRAATIGGALAAGGSHFIFGIIGMITGTTMSMYRLMMGGAMMSGGDFGLSWIIMSTIVWAIIGGVIGYLVAFGYNWAMKK
ncbi:MAG: hypothetical protein AABX02_03215 [archaeon]